MEPMKKEVLVVDNHPVMVKLVENLLEKEGHRVLIAEDGLSALEVLKTHTPDVIFTDLIMPRISGEKLCQMVRKMPAQEGVRLVILSAVAAEGGTNLAGLNADACIAKGPFDKMSKHILDQMNHEGRHDGAGQVLGIEDVYPRQITSELLSIKQQFDMTLRSMSEGIVETTADGRVVYANPAALSMVGLPEESVLASNFVDLFHEGDCQRVRNLLMSTEGESQPIPEDSPARVNGKEVSMNVFSVNGKDHKAMILILNDVSERKRMETQLLQAQKMEAVGTLAGGIAHDFNNLLMVIQGNASLMLMDIEPSHSHYDRIASIEKQVQSGSKLTNQLLGYARKGRYEVKPVDLNNLVRETSEVFGRTRKEIAIHQDLSPELSAIRADQGQMEQVLMNLFVNAADAMPRGGDLFVRTSKVAHEDLKRKVYHLKPGLYAELSVRDTGTGMDEKTMARIFDPFFTTKELGRGTGLGLASVYGIIKGHAGYIDVESEIGKGSNFRIYLPASDERAQETVREADQLERGTETILLIDDEEMILHVGQELLRALGYRTLTAPDGKEAVEIYRKNREAVDLVILDMVMPRLGGGEVFDQLKEINPEVKVLLSSGYSIDGEAAKILDRGCNGFIQKPFDLIQLSKSIRVVLGKEKA